MTRGTFNQILELLYVYFIYIPADKVTYSSTENNSLNSCPVC